MHGWQHVTHEYIRGSKHWGGYLRAVGNGNHSLQERHMSNQLGSYVTVITWAVQQVVVRRAPRRSRSTLNPRPPVTTAVRISSATKRVMVCCSHLCGAVKSHDTSLGASPAVQFPPAALLVAWSCQQGLGLLAWKTGWSPSCTQRRCAESPVQAMVSCWAVVPWRTPRYVQAAYCAVHVGFGHPWSRFQETVHDFLWHRVAGNILTGSRAHSGK